MEQVLISGYYGFGNAGDEAVLAAMLQQLSTLWPKARFVVLSGNPQGTMGEHMVEAIPRHNLRAVLTALRNSTVFVSGGGTLLQDVTSSRSLYYYLGMLLLARWHRLPVIIYGQGIGPFLHQWNRRLTLWVLGQVQLVIVRDQGAYSKLLDWGFDENKLCLGADPALALRPVEDAAIKDELGLSHSRPVLLVSLRPWASLGSSLSFIAAALDNLSKEGWQVVFLPVQFSADHPICQACAELMSEPAMVWSRPLAAVELLALVGQADYCLGMRLHSLIFAAIWGLPMVGLAYDPKVEEFLRELGLEDAVVGLPDAGGEPLAAEYLAERIRRVANEGDALTAQIKARTTFLTDRALAATNHIVEELPLL